MRDTTWQLVDWWAELKRSNAPTSDIDKLNTQTHCAPWSDRKQRVIEARMAIKAALANNYLQVAWNLTKGWCGSATSKAPRPSTRDFTELHHE